MELWEIIKAVLFGIVEGITEWLPISSTGHMILLDEFVRLDVRPEFFEVFLVVIQLGAILAVVVLYWDDIFPFHMKSGIAVDGAKMVMWGKLFIASIPAGVVGIVWDDYFNAMFYNYTTVAVMLIIFGILFIITETRNENRKPSVTDIAELTVGQAFIIGIFQMIAAIFPGTSRSGATIIGALLLGISRITAAEFTFFLAIPAMFGGSAVKLLKSGFSFTPFELLLLFAGMLAAYIVSMFAIKFLLVYIKKNNFIPFGWYRIGLGVILSVYFFLISV